MKDLRAEKMSRRPKRKRAAFGIFSCGKARIDPQELPEGDISKLIPQLTPKRKVTGKVKKSLW